MKELINKLGRKNLIIIGVATVILLILIISFIWYFVSISPVNKKGQEEIEITVPLGSGTSKIADILRENNIIRSKVAFRIYIKLNNLSFKAKYEFERNSRNVKNWSYA